MPFKYVPQAKSAAPVGEKKSLIQRGFEAYNTPLVDLLGMGESVDKFAQPGPSDVPLDENIVEKAAKKVLGETVTSFLPTTKAKMKGLATGATKAFSPALVAQAASLGTGVPAIAANTAIAAAGARDVLDSDKTAFERGMGAVGLIGGGAGAAAGARTLKAAAAAKPKAPRFEIESPALTKEGRSLSLKGSAEPIKTTPPAGPPKPPTAAGVPYGRPEPPPSKGATAAEKALAKARVQNEARDIKNLKDVERWKARNDAAKAKAAAEAQKIAENESKLAAIEAAKEGREATKPSISEGITAKTPEGGRSSMTRRFVEPTPPEEAGTPLAGEMQELLGLPKVAKAPEYGTPEMKARLSPKGKAQVEPVAQEMAPGLERDKIALKRYTNKVEANAIAKATGGEVHQDGPRQYSIRFRPEEVVEEVLTPSPTIPFDVPEVPVKRDMPRMTALEKGPDTPVPDGPRILGFGGRYSISGHPELGEFSDTGKATRALNALLAKGDDIPAELDNAIETLAREEAAATATATPDEAVSTMQELAAATDKPAPQIAPLKFPTAKLPGKSQAPVAEQASLLGEPTTKVTKLPSAIVAERAAAKTPEAPKVLEGGAIPMRMFKSSGEAAKEGYGDIKAAKLAGEKVPEAGRAIAGKAAQAAKRAEQPVKPTADIVPGPAELTSDDLKNLSPEDQMNALTDLVNKFKANKPRGGSTVSAFGAGQLDNMIKIAAENPAFTRAMTTLAGAGVGAGTSEDPVTGAVVGGAIGFGAPTLLNAINKARASGGGDESLVTKFKDNIDIFARMLPDFQRASLLSKPLPLFMNSVVGPWGAIVMHGLEDAVRFDKRGIDLLKLALNPKNFPKEYVRSFPKAKELIHSAQERTEGVMGELGPSWYRTATTYPGVAMTAGDEAAREMAKMAGYTDDEARAMTLTSEPYTSVGAGVSKLKKGATNRETGKRTWLLDMSLPFYRTNMNQLEQGLERTPFVGIWMNKYAKSKPAAWQQQLAQQVIGGGVGTVGYMLGEETPPEDAKYVLKFINNFGGQYGALASAGFMMGQASQRGLSDWRALTAELTQAMPMPSTQPITDVMQPLGAVTGLGPAPTEQQKSTGVWIGDVKVPSGFVPGILDPEDPLTGLLVGAVMPKGKEAQPQSGPTSRFKYVPQPRRSE